MLPCDSPAQRGVTRMPVSIWLASLAATAWSKAVSAPSSLIKAKAKGSERGWLARGLSTKEVAFELGRSASTVYTHAERIRKKLGVDTAAELVRYAERWRFDRG